MTKQFQQYFNIVFWISVAKFFILVPFIFIGNFKKSTSSFVVQLIIYGIYSLTLSFLLLLELIATVVGTYWRYSNEGKVCSGDFVTTDVASSPPYLLSSGRFIKIWLTLSYCFIGLAVCIFYQKTIMRR